MSDKAIRFGNAELNNQEHIPSKLQADTLFHFTPELQWLLPSLKNKMLSARYVCEDISVFNIPGLSQVAYPMKCFCDINLHRLKDHVDYYGAYGIAFSKKWGMDKGIQPVQYINAESQLCRDMSEALGNALKSGYLPSGSLQEELTDFLLLQLMYWKPYQGVAKKLNFNANAKENKCFCDESEWRFIPNVSSLNKPMIIWDQNILLGESLDKYNCELDGVEQASLLFEYEDIKHIILEKQSDYKTFKEKLLKWGLDSEIFWMLCSKVIIWDDIKEDV